MLSLYTNFKAVTAVNLKIQGLLDVKLVCCLPTRQRNMCLNLPGPVGPAGRSFETSVVTCRRTLYHLRRS